MSEITVWMSNNKKKGPVINYYKKRSIKSATIIKLKLIIYAHLT